MSNPNTLVANLRAISTDDIEHLRTWMRDMTQDLPKNPARDDEAQAEDRLARDTLTHILDAIEALDGT